MSVPGKIFIGGMPYSMDEGDLQSNFEKFGKVTDGKWMFVFKFQGKAFKKPRKYIF